MENLKTNSYLHENLVMLNVAFQVGGERIDYLINDLEIIAYHLERNLETSHNQSINQSILSV